MFAVNAVRAADGYAHGMHRERAAPRDVEKNFARVRVREKVLRMYLEPPHRGRGGRHFEEMRKPQPDARAAYVASIEPG